MGTREPRDGQEMLKSVGLSLQGVEPSVRPGWWQAYALSAPLVQKKMQGLESFRSRLSPDNQRVLDTSVQKTRLSANQLYILPLTIQKNLDGWIVLLDEKAQIVGFAPLGGFD